MEALEIKNDTHAKMESFLKKYTEGWNYKIKQEATLLLNAVTSFEFIISLIGLYRLLHPLVGKANCLQGRGVDITEVYDEV